MKIRAVKLAFAFGLAGGLSWESARAQEVPDNSNADQALISLLAIGDRPEITLTATKTGDFYNKPPESEVPPGKLFVKDKNEFKVFVLGLNTPVNPISHPGNTELKLYMDQSEVNDSKKEAYIKIPLPKEKVDLTVFLLRNPESGNWRTKPRALPFKNDLVSFPLNATRVINFSSTAIRVKIGASIFDLGASESRIVAYPTASQGILEYKIGTKAKEGFQQIADSANSYFPGTRMNLIVYDSDGKKRRAPVEHTIFMERTRQPSPNTATSANSPATSTLRQ